MLDRRLTQFAICICLFAFASKGLGRAQSLIAVTFDEEIIRIDPSTGAGTLIGTLPTNANAFGISYYDEKLWVLDQVADQLIVLEPSTASVLYTIPIDDWTMNGIVTEGDFDIDRNGRGYFMEGGGELSVVDLDTGFASEITTLGPSNVDGLSFAPNRTLWALQSGGSLYTVNTTTAVFTRRFDSTALSGLVGGMEFGPDGTPYVVSNDRLYRVDLTNGAYATIGAIGFDNVSGLTLGYVPEPALFSLVAVALFGAGNRRR